MLESLSHPNPSIDLVFRITSAGMESRGENQKEWDCARRMLVDLLEGKDAIKKKPWKPNEGDLYYIPSESNDSRVEDYQWGGDEFDYKLFESGFVCRTKEEAIELADKFVKVARWRI